MTLTMTMTRAGLSVWDLTIQWTTCFLCLLLLTTTEGLSVYPGPVISTAAGSSTKLTCYLSDDELRVSSATLSTCTLSWYRIVSSRREQMTRSRVNEDDPDVSMSLWRGHDGVPREAVVNIEAMKATLEGKYFCSLVCSGHVQASETVTVLLDTGSLWRWHDRGTVIASVISIAFVACLLIGALVLALKDSCCKHRHSSSDVSDSSSEILGESSSEGSGSFYDPPPRYSLVVVTDEEGNPRTELTAKNGDDKTGSSQSLVWFSLPPPNYQEALKILCNSGVQIMDLKKQQKTNPRPPPYSEAVSPSLVITV